MTIESAESFVLDERALEVRADQLSISKLEKETTIRGPAGVVFHQLLAPGAKLIVGPRGCGKTHLMRFAWTKSIEQQELPLAVYVSFNRYLRLEPLLRTKSNALDIFHGWIISLCYLGLYEVISEYRKRQLVLNDDDLWLDYQEEQLKAIATRLERGSSLPSELQEQFDTMSVVILKQSIDRIANALGKRRTVLLLDDAALTLAPEFLPDFFDFFRASKSSTIAPKASVYPGTTEYGPRFHVGQEADEVQVWVSVDDQDYSALMGDIGQKRLQDSSQIPEEIREYFKYASFGIPRAYLLLLNEFHSVKDKEGTTQSKINTILDTFLKNKEAEYLSLIKKVPKFETLITSGLKLFHRMCRELVEENKILNLSGEKQFYIGIQEMSERNVYSERMLSLLIEAGLLYGLTPVSHGKTRVYDRYMPHLGNLLRERAFTNDRGFSLSLIVSRMRFPSSKHPIRRSLSTLLGAAVLNDLKIDLPPCQNCHTARLSESSKHCHQCGAQLTDASAFNSCMMIELYTVPNLTQWQAKKLKEEMSDIRTIGDFLALNDPGSELQKIFQVGPTRATHITRNIEDFVEEFLV